MLDGGATVRVWVWVWVRATFMLRVAIEVVLRVVFGKPSPRVADLPHDASSSEGTPSCSRDARHGSSAPALERLEDSE